MKAKWNKKYYNRNKELKGTYTSYNCGQCGYPGHNKKDCKDTWDC